MSDERRRRRVRPRLNPLWSRTPLVLLRFRELFSALAAGALLLAIAGVAGPLFLSATSSSSLEAAIERTNRFSAGFRVAVSDSFHDRAGLEFPPEELTFEARDRLLAEELAEADHLAPRVMTIMSDAIESTNGDAHSGTQVRLIARTDALNHVQRLEGRDGNGVWLADTTAESLGLEPGDDLTLGSGGRPTSVAVDGIYRALFGEPSSPYWSSLYREIYPASPGSPAPPAFVIADQRQVAEIAEAAGEPSGEFVYEYPIALDSGLTLSSAARLHDHIDLLEEKLLNLESRLGVAFGNRLAASRTFSFNLPAQIETAQDTVATLRAPVDLLSIAGTAVALVIVAAAGAYGVHRRRTEASFLFARGMSPVVLGVKAAIESIVPVLIGSATGYLVARWIVGVVGPDAAVDGAALSAAARAVALTIPVSIALLGVVAAASMVKESEIRSTASGGLERFAWEIPVLVLAALAYNRISGGQALVSRGPDDVPQSSVYLLLFPVLLIGGVSGLGARAFRGGLKRARPASERASSSVFLAVHRLAGAGRLAVILLAASGLAVGIYVYAQTMAASLAKTTEAKAYVFTGSDVSVQIDGAYRLPNDFEFPHATVREVVGRAELAPSGYQVDLLGADAEDLRKVAFWDPSFGLDSLDALPELLRRDGGAGALPAVAVGDVPEENRLDVGGVEVPLDIVGSVGTFPGVFTDRTWLVVDDRALAAAVEASGGFDPLTDTSSFNELWIKGDPTAIRNALRAFGFVREDTLSGQEVLEQPAFVSVTRTFGFLQALGVSAALLVLVGIVLYIQARQRGRVVTHALARRMGLRSSAHLAALNLEIGSMLIVSAVGGAALGVVTAILLYSHVDPLPGARPNPLLSVSVVVVLPLLAALAVATAAGAWLAHRSAEGASVTEALRRAG